MKSVDREKIEDILRLLDRPIVLIGLMGAGKSKIGHTLASVLNLPFTDADEEIEKAAGMTISDIFEKFGEDYFRDGERRVMRRLADSGPCVIASGGGAVTNAETAELVWNETVSIWIKADIDLIVKRVKNVDKRPLLKDGNPEEILRALAEKRYPVYEKADILLDSHGGPIEGVINQAIEKLHNYLTSAGADRKAQ